MSESFDWLLVGATGQVGRCVLRMLAGRGRLAVLLRRPSEAAARAELAALAGADPHATVILGDVLSARLPAARAVVHAGGHSLLVGSPEEYFTGNVLSTIRLADHARETGAHLHLLSSIMVAMAEDRPLRESDPARPHPRQTRYAVSKCLAELAAERILHPDRLSVYRTADTVPDPRFLTADTRANHWMTLLLGTGGAQLCQGGADRRLWAVPGGELGAALAGLIRSGRPGRYHLLGAAYPIDVLRSAAAAAANGPEGRLSRLAGRLARLADRDFPIPPVDDARTRAVLGGLGLGWRRLDARYWQRFAEASAAAVASVPARASAPTLWWGSMSTSRRGAA